jgi:hypothetical protein
MNAQASRPISDESGKHEKDRRRLRSRFRRDSPFWRAWQDQGRRPRAHPPPDHAGQGLEPANTGKPLWALVRFGSDQTSGCATLSK